MSYERMHDHETSCDFPGCNANFDSSEGVKCAIVKDGKIQAFCAPHSVKLIGAGVNLRVLSEIRAEQKEQKEAPQREQSKREKEAREQAFIADLLKK